MVVQKPNSTLAEQRILNNIQVLKGELKRCNRELIIYGAAIAFSVLGAIGGFILFVYCACHG